MENLTEEEKQAIQRIKSIKDSLLKKLGESRGEIYDIQETRHFRASLYQDGHLRSTGTAEVSSDRVIYYPNVQEQLHGPLNNGVVLKVSNEKEVPLSQSEESFQTSNHQMWFFEL
jgi:hypothetical protein